MADTDALPSVDSLQLWHVGKEKRGMTVTFMLGDTTEARRWAQWLHDREEERDQALAQDRGF